jgi:hypothetical protein
VFHVFAEVHKVRRAHLHRAKVFRGFGEERILWREWRGGPGLAVILRDAETRHWTEHGPVVGEAFVVDKTVWAEAISAVIPHAIVDEAAGRVTAHIGKRIGHLGWRGILDLQIQRIVTNHHRVARGRLLAKRK